MPAKLVIASGIATGTEIWIEDDVSRVGSDPKCQVCLRDAELAAHAATLEYRGGDYILHNRGEGPIRLGVRELAGRASFTWQPGQELQLTSTLVLRLEVDGDPAPGPRPVARRRPETDEPTGDDQADAAVGAAAPPANRSKQLLQIGVIFLCFGGGAFMLLMDSSASSTLPSRNVTAEFSTLIKELSQEKASAELDPDTLRSVLQSARIAQLRGHQPRSQELYGHLRDVLLARRRPDGSFASKVEAKVWDFVEAQLRSPPKSDSSTS